MKLSESQRHDVHELLSFLSDQDILSLARTITNNLVTFVSAKDALEAIVLHEVDLQTFLSRRKITREILFKYLYRHKVDIPGNSEKIFLINKLIEVWEHQSKVPSKCIQTKPAKDEVETASQVDGNVGDINTLAEKFVSWFYSILNDYITCVESDKLCVEHFWNDCTLHLVMESPLESVVRDVHQNSEDVVRVLQEIQMQHKLYFNPNISSSGIRGQVDVHGLVTVMACGTLHQVNHCVGVFQQVFRLVRDPFMQNNWRIKSTSAILRSQKVSQVPVLNKECFKSLTLPQ